MKADGVSRRVAGGLLLGALAAPGLVRAQEAQIDEFRADQTTDRVHRSTVPVFINGEGPFRFAVDTAASASVVASDLVEQLNIAPAGELDMHTVIGLERVPAVRARTLSIYLFVMSAGYVAGSLVWGRVADAWGVRVALAAAGACVIVNALVLATGNRKHPI